MKGHHLFMSLVAFLALMATGCWSPDAVILPSGNGSGLPFDTLNFVWHIPKPWNAGQFSSSNLRPLFLNDSLMLWGFGEGFVCINANTGIINWKNDIGLNPSGYPSNWEACDFVLENGKIYTIAGNDASQAFKASVVCLSAVDGSLIWRHDLASQQQFAWYWSKYGASPNAIFYSTQSGHVVALSKADGSVLWDSPNGSTTIPAFDQAQPCYRNGVVYVGSGQAVTTDGLYIDGVMIALDANTGSVLWTKIIPGPDSNIIGYSNWKLLTDNEIKLQPIPTADGLIIATGNSVALMDSTGNLVWRSSPNVNGGNYVYSVPLQLCKGNVYGSNFANTSFFTFSLDALSGKINWVVSPSIFSASASTTLFIIDSSGLYEVSDDGEQSLWGQSLTDGSRFLYTPLFWYENYSGDTFAKEFLVHNKRVYYQTQDEIICIARK